MSDLRWRLASWLALLSGVVPVLATHAALALNVLSPSGQLAESFHCVPYWDGCVSVSRAVRSGPGLILFRALMFPAAVALAVTWLNAAVWLSQLRPEGTLQSRIVAVTGAAGALFLVLYVGWLGTEGYWSGWLRRYGAVCYFGLTALAQLLLVHALWPVRMAPRMRLVRTPVRLLFTLVCVQWFGGVASVAKRLLLSDPALIDRIENVIEWWFALALSAAFVAMAAVLRRPGYRLADSERRGAVVARNRFTSSRSNGADG